MRPRPHISPLPLDAALEQYRADLLCFFKARFGSSWRRNIEARGGNPGTLTRPFHCGSALRSIRNLEAMAVKLGFRPYVGRVSSPFERNSREYWPRLSESLTCATFAHGCVPSVAQVARLWMAHRSWHKPCSDVLPKSPHATSYHCNAGDGISNPMSSTFDAKQAMQAPVIANVMQESCQPEGGQTNPPTFAHSSPRGIKSHSRDEIPIDKL